FVCGSVHTIGARLGDSVDHDPGISAIFGGEGVGLDFELLNHVDVRLKGDLVLHHVTQVLAIDDVIGGVFAGTGRVDTGNTDAAGRREESAVVGAGDDGAGLEKREVEKETAV